MGIFLVDQTIEEGLLKNHNKRLKAHTSYHPPPKDGPKEAKSNINRQGTDYNHSTANIILIPTRYVGVSICLKGGL